MNKNGILLEKANSCSFLVFYASQTGQAESIAETLAQQASVYELTAAAFPLNDIREIKDLAQLPCPVVIIAATTGDGEPPENADRFWRKVRRKALPPGILRSLKFALLGLGDTNYNQFCNCGKEINKRLLELGAEPFHQPGWADDAVGLEQVVDDWLDKFWKSLAKLLESQGVKMASSVKQEGGLQLPILPPISLKVEYEPDLKTMPLDLEDPIQPFPLIEGKTMKASIISARYLTKKGSLKTTVEVTLKCQTVFGFEPGDAISIVCPNDVDEVNQIIDRLNLTDTADTVMILSVKEGAKGKIPAFVPPGSSFRQILTYFSDIRSPPKKNFLRLLAEFTTDEAEKNKLLELSSRQGSSLFESTVRFPHLSLFDILITFPSCRPTPDVLVEHLPRLIPRVFSISSSPLRSKDTFTIAFNVITFSKEDGRQYPRTGVCTGWLYSLARQFLNPVEDDDVLASFAKLSVKEQVSSNDVIIYRRRNHCFRLPEDASVPLVLVGPGTGIAPFVGFVEHRHFQKVNGAKLGEIFVYFGCRNKLLDYLYGDQLENYAKKETITKLFTSFSRDENQNGIKYVQHNLDKSKEEMVQLLLEKKGYLYVCGDANNMAKNVREGVTECFREVKGIDIKDAQALVAELVSEKRYLQDVWA